MMYKTVFSILLASGLALPAWAIDGVMLRDDSLRATASTAAKTLGKVNKGSKVGLLARQGGWTQVRANGKTGWVHLLSVRSNVPTGASKPDLAGVVTLTEKRDPNKVVAVAGLRGLTEEELRKAQYDGQEMQRLEQQATASAEARRFAEEGQLGSRQVAYLPAPKPATDNTSPLGGF